MAGDWIKLEKTTPDKPEIAILARKLNVSAGEAFLEWARVYIWADGVVRDDGVVPFLSLCEGDRLSRCCPGTFAALASPEIGWVELVADGLRFVNWSRHNGKSAKARTLDAEKKRRQREMSRKCPDANGTKSGPEKRREEYRGTPPITPVCAHNADATQGSLPLPPSDGTVAPKTRKRKPTTTFTPPTIEEVAAYCRERGNKIDPQAFVDHYESNGWKVGRAAMKDWRAAVRTWEHNGFAREAAKPGRVRDGVERKINVIRS